MILQLYPDITRIALRIRYSGTKNFLSDWENIQLVVTPGQTGCSCPPDGSPWILEGCWPGHRTGVDVANWRPDFPPMIIPALERDDEGRIVFLLDEQFYQLPPGRYTGMVRYLPHAAGPVNLVPLTEDTGSVEVGAGAILPPEYAAGAEGCPINFPQPPPPPPHPVSCVLGTFDIDLGPDCANHTIDQIAYAFTLNVCDEES